MNFAASLVAALALMQTAPAAEADAPATTHFQQCVDSIDADPGQAYEEGMAWSTMTGEVGGYRCAAMALIAQNRFEEGARRLEALANSTPTEHVSLRAELMYQAGNAWLLGRDAGHARSAFTLAIAALNSGRITEGLPDVYIDRARAYALEEDWRHSEEDLSNALDLRTNDALALRLRAYARMQQSAFDLAEADALAAVALEPTNVDALLMLGHAREAKRTGAPITPP